MWALVVWLLAGEEVAGDLSERELDQLRELIDFAPSTITLVAALALVYVLGTVGVAVAEGVARLVWLVLGPALSKAEWFGFLFRCWRGTADRTVRTTLQLRMLD